MFILNALPMALIPTEGGLVEMKPIEASAVPAEAASAIGHADTAVVISNLLGREVPAARISVPTMKVGETHIVAAYQGPRLPEGSTMLPDGATINFYQMTMLPLNAISSAEEEAARAAYFAR